MSKVPPDTVVQTATDAKMAFSTPQVGSMLGISFGITLVTSRRKDVNERSSICSIQLGFMYTFYSQRPHGFKQGRLAFFHALENRSSLENASQQSANRETRCSSSSP